MMSGEAMQGTSATEVPAGAGTPLTPCRPHTDLIGIPAPKSGHRAGQFPLASLADLCALQLDFAQFAPAARAMIALGW